MLLSSGTVGSWSPSSWDVTKLDVPAAPGVTGSQALSTSPLWKYPAALSSPGDPSQDPGLCSYRSQWGGREQLHRSVPRTGQATSPGGLPPAGPAPGHILDRDGHFCFPLVMGLPDGKDKGQYRPPPNSGE